MLHKSRTNIVKFVLRHTAILKLLVLQLKYAIKTFSIRDVHILNIVPQIGVMPYLVLLIMIFNHEITCTKMYMKMIVNTFKLPFL